MHEAYNPKKIEKKWQDIWEQEQAFAAKQDYSLPKFYGLIEFPYPSGAGLHVGHPRSNTAIDILARKRRMEGYNVLFPMGWDAFGLPTENFAIKNNIHPAKVTHDNVDSFRRQLKLLGFSFDWSREVNTTDPAFYKWTQWIFLQMYKRGLAYKKEMPINWCTSCLVGLANEEVVDGKCERCGAEVVRRVKSQWMLRITEYAQKLLDGLDTVDYIPRVKAQQRNWIGRSEGAEVDFTMLGGETMRIFTTRPDTLWGATYMVLSPEHPYIDAHRDSIENYDEVTAYREAAARKSDFERTEMAKDKTGVALQGIYAVNPVSGEKIPVWVSDYVLMTYGTGAIMAVPGHDQRDWEFATKFGLPIVEVVGGGDITKEAYTDTSDGIMVNSGFITGMPVQKAIAATIDWLEKNGKGEKKVNYKLRDWVFSRQRYWGEPIPLVHCEKCGWVAIPEEELPLTLPETDNFMPAQNGESPLSKMTDWANTTCPECGGPAQRETDTMPQWAGSSWYFLRYCDPHNDLALADRAAMDYWMPVDWYNGGLEHTTLHLLYSRFWNHFLFDIGVISSAEPYKKRTSHGMILGEGGEKMSKSRGNVVNPDDIVKEIGADSFRVYEMFMGAFDQPIPWSTKSARGSRRFLDRVWRLMDNVIPGGERKETQPVLHATIRKVSEDFENMKFNTAIAQIMTFVNEIYAVGNITQAEMRTLLVLLNPVAPHITEEIWAALGFEGRVYGQQWPSWDEEAIRTDTVEIAVQVNGKVRGRIDISPEAAEEEAVERALGEEGVRNFTDGKAIVKRIYVPGRLLNIVVK